MTGIEIADGVGVAFEPFLAEHAKAEFVNAGKLAELLLSASERKWTLMAQGEPLLVLGVLRKSFVGSPPEVWMLLCQQFEDRAVANTLRLLRLRVRLFALYPRLRCRVRHELDVGHKFVKLFGFQPLRDTPTHIIYEIKDGI